MNHRLPWLLASALLLSACGEGTDGETPAPTPSPTPSPSPAPTATPNANWSLVWSDEFDGENIDASKWQFEKNCMGGGNNELQCYTDRAENSYLADGRLHIVARQEAFSGPALGDDDPNYDPSDTSASRNYTSARLRSKGQGDWRYGRIEVAAQLPQGQGLWPAVWMLPTEWRYGGWPASGEIDIMEAVNSNTGSAPNDIHGTLHYGKFWPENSYTGQHVTANGNIWEDLHTYAVEWEANEIRWYLDGEHYATQQPASADSPGWFTYYWADQSTGFSYGDTGAPFDEAFHIIMNLAVGGNWPGAPDANSSFPQTLSVDYVRVYQCAPDGVVSADGSGCASNINPDISPIGSHRPAQKVVPLFDNTLQSLAFSHAGTDYQQLLNLLSWAPVDGDVQLEMVSEGDATHWQIEFLNAGNSFINVAESPIDGADRGVKLINMAQYGELTFNFKVLSKADATEFKVKLDSGWPNVSEKLITAPALDTWVKVSVPLSQLQANSIEAGSVDLSSVQNLFVLEASGPAKVQINQVQLVCLQSCDLQPLATNPGDTLTETVIIFDDEVNPVWDLGWLVWETASPHLVLETVDATDTSRGKVLDVKFTGADRSGLVFVSSSTAKDMRAFADTGALRFDIQVLDYASASSLAIKADCGHPCSSGDIPIGQPGMSGWQSVEVPVSDLVAGGLDLSQVNTPFVLLPEWDAQTGVHLQIDNIAWVLP